MYDEDACFEPTHLCPVCGREIPLDEDCCPDCLYLYFDMLGIL